MKHKYMSAYAAGAILLALIVAGACKKTSQDNRPILAVSVEPQRQMLEQIVGKHFRVVSMTNGNENPETYEPTMAKRMDLNNSKAYFTIGLLPFEASLTVGGTPGLRIINTSADIEPLYGTHSHFHKSKHSNFLHSADDSIETIHEAPDPHIWASVRNARLMARVMASNVMRIDPAHSAEYQANFEKLDNRLDSLDKEFTRRLAPHKGKTFMIWHPSLSYFARDYNLVQRAVTHETKELSVKQLADITDEALADSIKLFFFQSRYDSRQAASISEVIGGDLEGINTSKYDWEIELNRIVTALEND